MKLTKVLLKGSSDPNNVGQLIGSALLKGADFDLRMSDDGNWVILNGERLIPREMVLHVEVEMLAKDAATPVELPALTCHECGKSCASATGLASHRRKAHPEAA